MQSNLEDLAIKAALSGDWNQAIELNRQILANSPNHIPTLNRLAKALSQTGENQQAIAHYQQVLALDKFNPIAKKQCQLLQKSPCVPQQSVKITMTDFVEEPGKTKTYNLVRLGDPKILSSLQPGQEVNLVIKNHWIEVTSTLGGHIGCLADNISFKLKQKLNDGIQFIAVIRTANTNQASIFVRELKAH
jgi:tetratricopeptide (TPR) repeat protein